jgi:peptide-methionine (S)-S-oxide reductase
MTPRALPAARQPPQYAGTKHGGQCDEEIITLGGGCFWCTEAVYEQVQGVLSVQSGYSNGHVSSPPTSRSVQRRLPATHEVVRVRFRPGQISLREILEIFFVVHDPTTLNRQGNDVGTQYRSGIYWHHDDEQADVARAVMAEVEAGVGGRARDRTGGRDGYWPAEDYHQHYFANHPGQGYCAYVVAPKVEKFRKTFSAERVRRG